MPTKRKKPTYHVPGGGSHLFRGINGSKYPFGFLGQSDWVTVLAPRVRPLNGWQEYFAPKAPEKAAA